MANRHLSRSVILQTLFEWDFKGNNAEIIPDTLARMAEEFAPGLDDMPFMEHLIDLVVKKKTIIDQVISKAAPEWPVEKINAVERNLFRFGFAELLFGNYEELQAKVSLIETIDLVK